MYCKRKSVQPVHAVPSAAPQHISVSASTPRSAVVRWRDPPLDDQNGQIVHYVVRYFPADDRSSVREEEVEAAEGQDDVIEHVVDQLQPFTTYEFAVAAATAAGQGPFSDHSSVTMPQDGKLEARVMATLHSASPKNRFLAGSPTICGGGSHAEEEEPRYAIPKGSRAAQPMTRSK